jgi:hypothetical protein
MVESVGVNVRTLYVRCDSGRDIIFCVYVAKNVEEIGLMEVKGIKNYEASRDRRC